MEENVSAPQSSGGCQYIKTFRFSKACGSQTSMRTRVPRRPCETAGPTFSFRGGEGGVWTSMFCCCWWLRGPSTPALSIFPSLLHAFSLLGSAKIAFPVQHLWALPQSSILYLKSFYSKNAAILVSAYHIYLQWQEKFSFRPEVSSSGLLRTLRSTSFSRSFIFLASFRCCFQTFDICLFGDLNVNESISGPSKQKPLIPSASRSVLFPGEVGTHPDCCRPQ